MRPARQTLNRIHDKRKETTIFGMKRDHIQACVWLNLAFDRASDEETKKISRSSV